MDLFGDEQRPTMLEFEEMARRQGYCRVAGIDEAGRGALAGPVVAAAVILPKGLVIPGVDDSKKLSPAKRDQLFDVIMERALAVGVGYGDHLLIDRINILQATLEAMKEAVLKLSPSPAKVTRDRLMIEFENSFPGYGLASHKGYGCESHMAAIALLGPCEIHRKTFGGVKEHVNAVNGEW